ncbi:hypothetical protein APHAL10511_006347 [Amanita phalloides]|nr:hypothetical protein APHAL10511_006347 [Amanita phalloides]
MSMANRNPFSVLDEDSSPPPTPAPEPSAPSPSAPSTRKQKGPASRGGKYYPRGGARPLRDASQPQNGVEESSTEPRNFESGRARGRGRGGERGAGGERGTGGERGARGGRRPFDRHSQTGKTDSDKKYHQGWGGDDGKEEFKTEQAATVDAATEGGDTWGGETSQQDWGAVEDTPADTTTTTTIPPVAEEGNTESRPRKEKEEEDNTLTLDQYLAKQKEKDAAIPKLDSGRKANEGADDNIWKGAVALTKDEEKESYFVGKTRTAPKARAKKEEKVFIEIDARFERPDRGGRGRGRGGDRGRGGRGRGGVRGDRQNGPSTREINVADEVAFPSLS